MLRRVLPTLLVAVLLTASLGACGGDDQEVSGSSVPASAPFNDADVAFATQMIPHHAQALAMVDLTLDRDLSPEVAALAEEIRAAQAPEIETMTDWLEDWDQPVPETERDHANAHGDPDDGDVHDDMPGMMSGDDMDALEAASDAEFEDMWLAMMIEHHEGAVTMAETEVEEGEFPAATELAAQVVEGQQSEIDRMEQLLS